MVTIHEIHELEKSREGRDLEIVVVTIHETHELEKPREGQGREIGHRFNIVQVRAQKIFNRRLEVIVTKSLQGQSDLGQGSQCYEGQDQGNACRLEGRGLENLAIAKENLWKDGQGSPSETGSHQGDQDQENQ